MGLGNINFRYSFFAKDDIMKNENILVGYSDHSGSLFPPMNAMSKGANLIEVHVTFDKRMFGPDTSSSITIEELKQLVDYRDAVFQMDKSIVDKDYGILIPTILISYSRSYFSFRGLRFTFDNNIEYINLRAQIPWKCRDPECVMEIKTEFNIEDDYISDVIKMATSRFSKYCRGIEMLNELANYN